MYIKKSNNKLSTRNILLKIKKKRKEKYSYKKKKGEITLNNPDDKDNLAEKSRVSHRNVS